MARFLFTSRGRNDGACASARPSCKQPGARARSCSAAGWRSPALLVLLAFAGLFARFVYLQVVQHEHYQTLAETNRIAIVPIVPNRGVITDRNGVVLAQSYSAYTLEITAGARQEPRRRRSTRSPRSSTSSRATASASASSSTSRRTSRACRCARG